MNDDQRKGKRKQGITDEELQAELEQLRAKDAKHKERIKKLEVSEFYEWRENNPKAEIGDAWLAAYEKGLEEGFTNGQNNMLEAGYTIN